MQGVLERLYYYLTVADLSLQMRAECVAVLRRLQVFDFAQVLLSDDWLLVLIELALRHERQACSPSLLRLCVRDLLVCFGAAPIGLSPGASAPSASVLRLPCFMDVRALP